MQALEPGCGVRDATRRAPPGTRHTNSPGRLPAAEHPQRAPRSGAPPGPAALPAARDQRGGTRSPTDPPPGRAPRTIASAPPTEGAPHRACPPTSAHGMLGTRRVVADEPKPALELERALEQVEPDHASAEELRLRQCCQSGRLLVRVAQRVREGERALCVLERPLLVAVVGPQLPELALDRDGESEVVLRLAQRLLAAIDRLAVVVETHDGEAVQDLGAFMAAAELGFELLEQLACPLERRCRTPCVRGTQHPSPARVGGGPRGKAHGMLQERGRRVRRAARLRRAGGIVERGGDVGVGSLTAEGEMERSLLAILDHVGEPTVQLSARGRRRSVVLRACKQRVAEADTLALDLDNPAPLRLLELRP